MTDSESLATSIVAVLNSQQARWLANTCRNAPIDDDGFPIGAAGYLYQKLLPKFRDCQIKDLDSWVFVNGLCHLRNFLRSERNSVVRQRALED